MLEFYEKYEWYLWCKTDSVAMGHCYVVADVF